MAGCPLPFAFWAPPEPNAATVVTFSAINPSQARITFSEPLTLTTGVPAEITISGQAVFSIADQPSPDALDLFYSGPLAPGDPWLIASQPTGFTFDSGRLLHVPSAGALTAFPP